MLAREQFGQKVVDDWRQRRHKAARIDNRMLAEPVMPGACVISAPPDELGRERLALLRTQQLVGIASGQQHRRERASGGDLLDR